jgi:hypothetical protein
MKTEYKMIIGVMLVTVLLVVGVSLFGEKKEIKEQDRLTKLPLGEKIEEMESPHISLKDTHESYNSNPPTSGPHTGNAVAGGGIKDAPVPDEIVVHSLEHGAVVLWYRDDVGQEDLERLKKVFNEAVGKKIMIPRNNMDKPIALTSWNYRLLLDTVDEEKIKGILAALS